MSASTVIVCALLAQNGPVEFPAHNLIPLDGDGTVRQITPYIHMGMDHSVLEAVDLAIGPDGLLYVVKPTQIQADDAPFVVLHTIDREDPNSQFGAITID